MQIDGTILKTDERIAYTLRSLYRRFGYSQYKMSKFEEYALYVRHKDFLVSEGIISFTDRDGRLLALKPDVTLSIINNRKDEDGAVQKLYYDENVYRTSGSSHGYKEIKQTGLECIGDIGELEICEVILLALRSLHQISSDAVLELSHVGLCEAILEQYGLSSDAIKQALKAIGQKSESELEHLCRKEGLAAEEAEELKVFLLHFGSFSAVLEALSPLCRKEKAQTALQQFASLLHFLSEMGEERAVKVDFSLRGDMNYYSGAVFRGYVKGIPTGILSGGQYDRLMRKLGRSAGAIGFAVYLDALERLNPEETDYDVDVLLLHGGNIAAALKTAESLSENGTTVRVCDRIPVGIRYRNLLNLTEKGETQSNGTH